MSGPNKWEWEKALRTRSISEGIKPNHQQIALLMATYADGNGTGIRPTVATLVKQSGWSHSVVNRARKWLIESGWIKREKLGASGKASLYRLTIPPPKE